VFPKAELIHLSIKFDQNPQIWIGHTWTRGLINLHGRSAKKI
jgi:hypothetical protein